MIMKKVFHFMVTNFVRSSLDKLVLSTLKDSAKEIRRETLKL